MNILQGSSPIYPLWGSFMLILSLILIDREKYQYLLFNGLLGAIITSIILQINIHLIQSWRYIEMEPFAVLSFLR